MDKASKAHNEIPDSTQGGFVYFPVFVFFLGLSMPNDKGGPAVQTLHSHRTQWIRHLATNQGIPGSNPGGFV